MSYTPTEWKTGDVITAEKLNNMESGIASALGSLVIIRATATESVETGETTIQPIDPLILPNTISKGGLPVLFIVTTAGSFTANSCYIFTGEKFDENLQLTGYDFSSGGIGVTVALDGSIAYT